MRLDGKEQSPNTPQKSASSSFANGSSTNGASTNGESNGHTSNKLVAIRPSGNFFGHDREEVTRILIQSLTDLGYHGAATQLSRESGYELENTSVAAFRHAIQEGEWAEAEALLFGPRPDDLTSELATPSRKALDQQLAWIDLEGAPTYQPRSGLPLAEGANKREMLFLIRQQKYLEMLEDRDLGSALSVLRQEITPLHQDTSRLHSLSSLMMCPSASDLRAQAQWDGAAGTSRTHLLSELSTSIAPSVMIPEHRLAILFDQVQETQIAECLHHNTEATPSLYHDHTCDRGDFPLDPLTELRDHTDEVWFVTFSPTGKYLASGSKNNQINIYKTSNWQLQHQLVDEPGLSGLKGICYLAWSPDDCYLISCSIARQFTVYDMRIGGRPFQTVDTFSYPVSAAVWLQDGQHFVVSSHDVEHPLGIYKLGESQPVQNLLRPNSDYRVLDCAISADGSRLVAVTNDRHILVFDLHSPSRPQIDDFTVSEQLTSVEMSADGSQLLLGMKNSMPRLMDTTTGEILQQYEGMKQSEFVVRASFGGAQEGFVVSGSEDSQIYIHRRHSGALVAALPAHSPTTVNDVVWHPSRLGIFASAGDDGRVVIWGSQTEIKLVNASARLRS